MKKSLSVILILSFVICSFFATKTIVVADEIEYIDDGFVLDTEDRAEIYVDLEMDGELSAYYNPRDLDYLTPVELQDGGTCWMYATTAAIEQHVSVNYGAKFNISEAHALVALSDKININNYSSGYYNNGPKVGRTQNEAFQYYTNWSTPIYYKDTCDWESCVLDYQYPSSKLNNNPINIDEDFLNAKPLFNVTGTKYIVKEQDNIKRAIMKYGAVIADTHLFPKGFQENENDIAYYYSNHLAAPNHTFVIVGWDDNYNKDKFKESARPQDDGAWLVRDSGLYGPYYWVSYFEGSLYYVGPHMSVITDVQIAHDNEYMLSYDYQRIKLSKVMTEPIFLCNVFDVSDYNNVYNQINKVMFYVSARGYDNVKSKCTYEYDGICDYEIKVLPVDDSGHVSVDYENYSCLASGQTIGEGFVTVNLNTPYSLNTSQKCAIVIKLIPNDNKTALCIPYSSLHPCAEANTSFFGTVQNNDILWMSSWKTGADTDVTGNLIIRPILSKSDFVEDDITINPTEVIPDDYDADIYVSSINSLFNIHTSNGMILRENVDYERTADGIYFYSDFTNSFGRTPTEVVLEFKNEIKKTIYLIPQSVIAEIDISGKTIVGDTLTANCAGIPEREFYDLDYCWQYSSNGNNWNDIIGVNSNQYIVNQGLLNCFIRVIVTPKNRFGNVFSGNTSPRTATRVVILGDVNGDGEITINDIEYLNLYLSEQIDSLSDEQNLAADVNRDGYVNVKDVTEIQRIICGII